MNEKELREVNEQLAQLEERASGLAPLAETAEQSEIDARAKELVEIEETRAALLAKKEELEATKRAAEITQTIQSIIFCVFLSLMIPRVMRALVKDEPT